MCQDAIILKLQYYSTNANPQCLTQYKDVRMYNVYNHILLPPWALTLIKSHKLGVEASSPKYEDIQGMHWKPGGGWI